MANTDQVTLGEHASKVIAKDMVDAIVAILERRVVLDADALKEHFGSVLNNAIKKSAN